MKKPCVPDLYVLDETGVNRREPMCTRPGHFNG